MNESVESSNQLDEIKTEEHAETNDTEINGIDESKDDDLKSNGTVISNPNAPQIPITTVYAMDLHNNLLFADQKQYIDIRPSKEYDTSRIIRFINIPINSDEVLVAERLFDCSEFIWYGHGRHFKLYVVSNQEMMDKGTDIEWYRYLGAMLLKIKMKDDAFERHFAGFNVLNTDFDTFAEDFSHLIRTDDPSHDDQVNLQYPNIVVTDRLYLGDSDDAKNREFITQFKITHILNVTIVVDNEFEDDEELDIQYLKREIRDDSQANMAEQLDVCLEFIDNALNANNGDNQNRVMVHCFAGVSRSASVVIAWLMKTRDMEFDDALPLLQEKRAIVWPNKGFRRQLKAWRENGFQAPESEPDEEEQTRQKSPDGIVGLDCE